MAKKGQRPQVYSTQGLASHSGSSSYPHHPGPPASPLISPAVGRISNVTYSVLSYKLLPGLCCHLGLTATLRWRQGRLVIPILGMEKGRVLGHLGGLGPGPEGSHLPLTAAHCSSTVTPHTFPPSTRKEHKSLLPGKLGSYLYAKRTCQGRPPQAESNQTLAPRYGNFRPLTYMYTSPLFISHPHRE